jgi:hypothetical protein
VYLTSLTEPTKERRCSTIFPMAEMPNQIREGRADLMIKIERARRLAKEVPDHATAQRLLALAAEYERKLAAHK